MEGSEHKKSNYPMQGFCNAKTRSGKPCRNRPVDGRSRCRLHGGKSLQGKAHGRYKHGFYTKEMKQFRREMRENVREINAIYRSLAGMA